MQKLSDQEVFDIVVAHARKQKVRCVTTDSNGKEYCRYKNCDGLKCFAGALIPIEDYRESFERHIASEVDYFYDRVEDIELLLELQGIHDGSSTNEFWEKEFQSLADSYDLTYSSPEIA